MVSPALVRTSDRKGGVRYAFDPKIRGQNAHAVASFRKPARERAHLYRRPTALDERKIRLRDFQHAKRGNPRFFRIGDVADGRGVVKSRSGREVTMHGSFHPNAFKVSVLRSEITEL